MTGPDQAATPVVLAADDDEDVLELVSLTLRRGGCEVIKARDGDEALQLALSHQPDLAVLDVMMPKQNGYELVASLRQDERTKLMPIILLSARAGRADALYGRQVGADEYIQKPFDSVELVERVEKYVRRGLAPRR
jgi:DNA-binding response OmpR family regulator